MEEELLFLTPEPYFLNTLRSVKAENFVGGNFNQTMELVTSVLEHLSSEIYQHKKDTNKRMCELATFVTEDYEEVKQLIRIEVADANERGSVRELQDEVKKLNNDKQKLIKEIEEKDKLIKII